MCVDRGGRVREKDTYRAFLSKRRAHISNEAALEHIAAPVVAIATQSGSIST